MSKWIRWSLTACIAVWIWREHGWLLGLWVSLSAIANELHAYESTLLRRRIAKLERP